MKSTGMVRKIDDLGRIVIPKEIRRTMRIKNGDSVEMFTDEDKLIIHKIEPLDLFSDLAKNYCDTVYDKLHTNCIICTSEAVVSHSGSIAGRKVSEELKSIIEKEEITELAEGKKNCVPLMVGDEARHLYQYIVPVVCLGERYGAIVVFSGKNEALSDLHKLFVQHAANFLCGQLI